MDIVGAGDISPELQNLLDTISVNVASIDLRRSLMMHLLPIIDDNDLFIKIDKDGKSRL